MFKISTIDQAREMIPYLNNYPSIGINEIPRVMEIVATMHPLVFEGYQLFGFTPALAYAGIPMTFLFKKKE